MKTAFLFGGSGYIGQYIIARFIELNRFESYVIYDIISPQNLNKLPKKVQFVQCNVKFPIPDFNSKINQEESWIFNLAAIHREPGHEAQEYLDTNINGAKNISIFAEKTGVLNVFFTSSIAPYGKSVGISTEHSELNPQTPYGISKKGAEEIHRNWRNTNLNKRLIIVRPSVIYGPGDIGNILRTIKALKKGIFVLPNGGNVIKAYGYVFGLIDSIMFTMEKTDREIIYNYAEYPLLNLKEMTQEIKKELHYIKPTWSLPVGLLAFIAGVLQFVNKILGKKSDIHPVRVRKAGFPTNIKPQYLIDNGFDFRYDFQKSLKHWKSVAPEDFI